MSMHRIVYAYSLGQWVSDRYCVGEVAGPYLSSLAPYSPEEVIAMFMIFLANITMHRYNFF